MKLRCELIESFCNYFHVGDINVLSNLIRIYDAGLEFNTVEELESYLQNTFNRDGSRK